MSARRARPATGSRSARPETGRCRQRVHRPVKKTFIAMWVSLNDVTHVSSIDLAKSRFMYFITPGPLPLKGVASFRESH